MKRRKQSSKGPAPWWFGGLFILAGTAIMGLGAGLIPADPSSVHAPGWVIVLCGVVFAMGGVMACMPNDQSETPLNYVFLLVMMICFASAFSWVAFGPGEREFSGSVSGGGVGVGGSVGSIFGRVVFGFGSIMLWAFVAAIFSKFIKLLRSSGAGGRRSRGDRTNRGERGRPRSRRSGGDDEVRTRVAL